MANFVITLDLANPENLKLLWKAQMAICQVVARLSDEEENQVDKRLQNLSGEEAFEVWLRVSSMLNRKDPYTPCFLEQSKHRTVDDAAEDIYRRFCSPTQRTPQEVADRFYSLMDQMLASLEVQLFGQMGHALLSNYAEDFVAKLRKSNKQSKH